MRGLELNKELVNKKILILVPHPDDEIIGVGGTLAWLKNVQAQVDCVCVCSSGIPSPDGRWTAKKRNDIRITEWKRVMSELNVHNSYIHSVYGDKYPFVNTLRKNRKEIEGKIDISVYDFIFVPGFFEQHVEHKFLTYEFLPHLLKKSKNRNQNIVLYEVWSLLSLVTDYIDISEYMEEKVRLLKIYETQCNYTDYDHRVEGLNRYRGLMGGRVDYAEAFQVMGRRKYRMITSLFGFALTMRTIGRKIRKRK